MAEERSRVARRLRDHLRGRIDHEQQPVLNSTRHMDGLAVADGQSPGQARSRRQASHDRQSVGRAGKWRQCAAKVARAPAITASACSGEDQAVGVEGAPEAAPHRDGLGARARPERPWRPRSHRRSAPAARGRSRGRRASSPPAHRGRPGPMLSIQRAGSAPPARADRRDRHQALGGPPPDRPCAGAAAGRCRWPPSPAGRGSPARADGGRRGTRGGGRGTPQVLRCHPGAESAARRRRAHRASQCASVRRGSTGPVQGGRVPEGWILRQRLSCWHGAWHRLPAKETDPWSRPNGSGRLLPRSSHSTP